MSGGNTKVVDRVIAPALPKIAPFPLIKRAIALPNTNACGLLDDLAPQEKPAMKRKPKITSDHAVVTLEKGFAYILSRFPYGWSRSWYEFSKKNRIIEKTFAASDIERFCLRLAKYETHKKFQEATGLFISYLIENSPDSDFTLNLQSMTVKIDDLGWHNKKNLAVYGNVGNFFCKSMISGNVVLHGNAGVQAAASLEDGQVIIKGNAGGNAGNGLYGGSLLIEGDTERGLGTLAHGGVIRVNGKVEGFGRPAYEIDKNGGYDYSVSKVTIYNGDKLIIDKGKFNDGPSKGVTWD